MQTPDGMAAAMGWTQGMIDRLKPGGVWMLPRAGTAYTFNRDTKNYRRLTGRGDGATEVVLHAMGWTRDSKEAAR
jgi:hypothetical protein